MVDLSKNVKALFKIVTARKNADATLNWLFTMIYSPRDQMPHPLADKYITLEKEIDQLKAFQRNLSKKSEIAPLLITSEMNDRLEELVNKNKEYRQELEDWFKNHFFEQLVNEYLEYMAEPKQITEENLEEGKARLEKLTKELAALNAQIKPQMGTRITQTLPKE